MSYSREESPERRSPSPWQHIKETLGIMSSPQNRPPTPPDLQIFNASNHVLSAPSGFPSSSVGPRNFRPPLPVPPPPTFELIARSQPIPNSDSILQSVTPLVDPTPGHAEMVATSTSNNPALLISQLPEAPPALPRRKRKRAMSEGTLDLDLTPPDTNLAYPPPQTQEFRQAPSKPGPLVAANKPGLTRLELEKTTRSVHIQTLATNTSIINRTLELPLLPPAAILHLQAAIQVLESRKADTLAGRPPPPEDGIEIIDLTGEPDEPDHPRRNGSRACKANTSYSGRQSSRKRLCLSSHSKSKVSQVPLNQEVEDNEPAFSEDNYDSRGDGEVDPNTDSEGVDELQTEYAGPHQHAQDDDDVTFPMTQGEFNRLELGSRVERSAACVGSEYHEGSLKDADGSSDEEEMDAELQERGSPIQPMNGSDDCYSEHSSDEDQDGDQLESQPNLATRDLSPEDEPVLEIPRPSPNWCQNGPRIMEAEDFDNSLTEDSQEVAENPYYYATLDPPLYNMNLMYYRLLPLHHSPPLYQHESQTADLISSHSDSTPAQLPHQASSRSSLVPSSSVLAPEEIDQPEPAPEPSTASPTSFISAPPSSSDPTPAPEREPTPEAATTSGQKPTQAADGTNTAVESNVAGPLVVAALMLKHQDAITALMDHYGRKLTHKLYAEGREVAFTLINDRLQALPIIHEPKWLLPKGHSFDESELNSPSWIKHLQDNYDIDFFGVGPGEPLFPQGVWSGRLYAANQKEPTSPPTEARVWKMLRAMAAPSNTRQADATRVFHDAVAIAGDRLIDHEKYSYNPQATPIENSSAFLNHLLSTRPTVHGGKVPKVTSSRNCRRVVVNDKVDPESLGNIHKFALAIHDIIIALVVLDRYSLMGDGKDSKAVAARATLTKEIARIKKEGFSWGPLLGFFGAGVRGIFFVSQDHRQVSISSVLGGLQVINYLARAEGVVTQELIWNSTHSYIMELIVNAYGIGKGGQYSDTRIDKVQLATRIAYDVGYYWSVKVPSLPVTPLPKLYDGGPRVKGLSLVDENAEDRVDLD